MAMFPAEENEVPEVITREEIHRITREVLEEQELLGLGIEITYRFDEPISKVTFTGCSSEVADRLRPVLLSKLLGLYIEKTTRQRLINEIVVKGF